MASETQLRAEIVRFSHLCYERNLLVSLDGNLSVRLSDTEILCTRAGVHKGFLQDEDLVVIDRRGQRLRGRGQPTSEMAMHLACYDERPDIHAVIHTHPPVSIAFTIAGVTMARCVLPEVVLTLGTVPTVPYETTGTQALADRIRPYVREHDAILMDRHGAVCLGRDLLEAFCRLETMEHTAFITKTARDLGGLRELSPEEAVKLRAMGLRRYGGPPSAVAKAGDAGADLPEACLACSGCANPTPAGIAPKAELRMARVGAQAPHTLASAAASVAAPGPATSGPASLEDRVVAEVLRSLRG